MKITVVEEGTRSTLDFDARVIRVGRAIDNDIRLSTGLASRHHCRIEKDADGAWVIDLGSSNGTQVNGRRVERGLLGSGDVITIGDSQLHIEPREQPVPHTGETVHIEPPDVDAALGHDVGSVGLTTETGEVVRDRENLRVFAQITRALARETEFGPLLRLIVDSAIALVGGERGFLLLTERDPSAAPRRPADAEAMTVRIARQFDRSDIPVPSSR
ncbi:MAG: FHA domain-containing protein, partial [Planctomycetota bacterium]|nr:FHA domain-containing protein [Planctomycetota bacterium]